MDVEKIESDWTMFQNLTQKLDDENINTLLDELSEKIIMCPASAREDSHGCHAGGLILHSLMVTNAMRKINSSLNLGVDTASILKVGLLHEIGKIGSRTEDYFLNQDSKWHKEKLGQMYKYNENLPKMTVSHRTLFLLQSYGVTLTREEWEAIATSQGHHLDENKFYAYSKEPLTKLLHAAKMMVVTSA